MVGPKKNLQNKGSQMAGKRILLLAFVNTVFHKSHVANL